MDPAGRIVMADAQFGTISVLRPPTGFEALYDGQSAYLPIYFYPRGRTFDDQALALRAGYDPDLIRGLPVPMGSRVVIWIPNMYWVETAAPLVVKAYTFKFIWRYRNLFDYRVSRIPWHLARGRGPNDTTGGGVGDPRVIIPAAYNSVIYNQAEDTLAAAPDTVPAVQRCRAEFVKFGFLSVPGPIIPPGFPNVGVIQQGVYDPAVAGAAALRPGFLVHEMQALGDELIIAMARETEVLPNWGLLGAVFPGNADVDVSNKLGIGYGDEQPDVGLYVSVGSAP